MLYQPQITCPCDADLLTDGKVGGREKPSCVCRYRRAEQAARMKLRPRERPVRLNCHPDEADLLFLKIRVK